MAKEPPKPLVEVERAKEELRFNEAIKKCKTEKDFDAPLLEYVFGVFIAEAEALLDSGSKLNWPVATIRQRIEKALSDVIDETFDSKHYNGQRLDSEFWKPGFVRTSTRAVRASDEWRLIQENLKALAEWQAGADDASLPPPDSSLPTARKVTKGPRQGYREEIRAWMHDKHLDTVNQAALTLHMSKSTLKSIMSSVGETKYSSDTLKRVLEVIRSPTKG